MKKTILLLIIILCHLQTGMAQFTSDTAVAVVQKQLDAYNAKDLSLFLSVFHTDAALYNLGNETPIARGEEELKTIYGRLFEQSPNLHSNVVSRQVIGNKVLDYEVITGRNNQPEPLFLIAIYEVENGKIKRCYFVRE